VTLNILLTVEYYGELLQKVKIDHCSQDSVAQNMKISKNLKRYDRCENAVCAP